MTPNQAHAPCPAKTSIEKRRQIDVSFIDSAATGLGQSRRQSARFRSFERRGIRAFAEQRKTKPDRPDMAMPGLRRQTDRCCERCIESRSQ
jgi:hypothetical protein